MGENNLHCRFEDWISRERKIKKQAIYDYRNLNLVDEHCSKVVELPGKHDIFVKNYEILFNYFEEKVDLIPWKHTFCCTCEDCISYFFENNCIICIYISFNLWYNPLLYFHL